MRPSDQTQCAQMKRRDVFTPRCNTQVEETGCEILPDFADGAKLLVPISAGQLSDTANDIIGLLSYHV